MRQSARLNFASPRAQTHGAAQFFHTAQFAQFVDNPVRGGRIKLAGIGIRETAHVACELDARRLHAQADTEIGNLFFASIADRNQHPLNTALAKAPRNQQAIVVRELFFVGAIASFETLGFHPIQIQFQIVRQRAVHQCLFQRLVGILILHIFANDADSDLGLRVVNPANNFLPILQIAILSFEPEITKHQGVHTLTRKHHRHLVNGSHILCGDHGFFFHVAEERDL